jgi:hypothetical protein
MHLYAFHLHIGFSTLFFFGVALFYHWAKTQPPAFQKNFALIAMVAGAVAVFATVPFCLAGMALMHSLAMPTVAP